MSATVVTEVKEQVVDRVPKRIKELQFGILYRMYLVSHGAC